MADIQTKQQIKSKERVAQRGEVFTASKEVTAMCDLVKSETERIDSRFLEPACGDGNFLEEILKRKLVVVKKRYKKNHMDYEQHAIIALGSIYGIDIMEDNCKNCRKRLFNLWHTEYKTVCKKYLNEDVLKTAEYILNKNIVCGNALSMKCVDKNGNDTANPIVFSQWAFITDFKLQRKDYRFDHLLEKNQNIQKSDNSDSQQELFDMQTEIKPEDDGSIFLCSYTKDYRSIWKNGK